MVTAAEVDALAREIETIERQSGLDRTLAVGKLILHRFFHGRIDVWKDKRRQKSNSIRRLAAHASCPLGKTALSQAVGVYVASLELASVIDGSRLSSSLIAAVLPLSLDLRVELLIRANREGWSV